MIKSISWNEFLTSIGFLMAAYYLVIVMLYYRKECLDILSNRGKLALPNSNQKQNIVAPVSDVTGIHSLHQSTADNTLMPVVHELMEELNQVITIAGKKRYAKEELVFSIQQVLQNYTQLRQTTFQTSINSFIESETGNHCSIHLSAGEINTLWMS